MLSNILSTGLVAISLALTGCHASPAPPLKPRSPWNGDSWHKYVRSPESTLVKPASIVEGNTTGNVSNPSGLITGDAPTVLTRESVDEEAPSIVVDFGMNVVGLISLHFEGSESPSDRLAGLRLAFSETRECLTDRSDFTRSDNARHEVYFIHSYSLAQSH
jgi:hypothetical protein